MKKNNKHYKKYINMPGRMDISHGKELSQKIPLPPCPPLPPKYLRLPDPPPWKNMSIQTESLYENVTSETKTAMFYL